MDDRGIDYNGGRMFWSVKIRKKFVGCLAVALAVVLVALYCVFTNPCAL